MFKKVTEILKTQNLPQDQELDRTLSTRQEKKQFQNSTDLFNFLDLIFSWDEIVGPKLALNTIPLKNQGSTLTIMTNHSAYSQILSYRESALLEKIFKKFPDLRGKIKKTRYQVGTQHFEQTKKDLLQRAGHNRPKLSQKEYQELHPHNPHYKKLKEEALHHIEDLELNSNPGKIEDLEEILLSIMIQSKLKP